MATAREVIPKSAIPVLDHGFVRLDSDMASDLAVVNGARVSFARVKAELDEADEGLIRFLMREKHASPFEHAVFRFHIRCPIFVAREWMRHRWSCLTGDTLVTFVDGKGNTSPDHRKRVDELWRMWTAGERNGHALSTEAAAKIDSLAAEGESMRAISSALGVGRRAVSSHPRGANAFRDGKWRMRKMKLHVLNETTEEFETGYIADLVETGIQPVYRLTLADGKHLTCTENHRLLTDGGWMTMRQAVGLVGDGERAVMTRRCELMTNGLPAHRNYEWMSARRARRPPDARWSREQAPKVHRKSWKLTARAVRVNSVEYAGSRQTYDLCVGGSWHNFVANGIVVHNSFNEFSLRYAKASDDFYVPSPEDVRTQVGKPGAYSFEPVSAEIAEQTQDELRAVYEQAFATYERLVELGVARELARCVIPVGAYTEFYWTVNARALMNFVSLRNAEMAQREIRRYAEAVEQLFAAKMPITHAAFVANNRVAP